MVTKVEKAKDKKKDDRLLLHLFQSQNRLDDSTQDDAEAKNHLWSITGPLNRESNFTRREMNHSLFH